MKVASASSRASRRASQRRRSRHAPMSWQTFWDEPAVDEGIIGGLWKMARLAPWLAVIFILAILLPPDLNLRVGSLRLSPYRIVLLTAFLPCLLSLLTGKSGKLTLVDGFIFMHALWAVFATCMVHGAAKGLESGGIYVVETVGPYLLARRTIRSRQSLRAIVSVITLTVFAFALVAMYESLTNHHVLREISRTLFGGPNVPKIGKRMGLHRAFATFEHPILYGVYCASVMAFLFYAMPPMRQDFKRLARVVVVWLAAFFSLSAGPLAAMLVQVYVAGYEIVTRMFRVSNRWWIFFGLLVLAYVTVDILSNRGPVTVALHYLTFSRTTAYNRLLIWEYGSAEALRHPIFGIGFNDWTRPGWMSRSGSMDNFWLLCAVRYGMFCFFTLAGAMLTLIFMLAKQPRLTSAGRRIRMAWIITIFAWFISGATVHFWNALFVYYFFFLGMIVWLATDGDLENRDDPTGLSARERARRELEENRRAQRIARELEKTRSLPGRSSSSSR